MLGARERALEAQPELRRASESTTLPDARRATTQIGLFSDLRPRARPAPPRRATATQPRRSAIRPTWPAGQAPLPRAPRGSGPGDGVNTGDKRRRLSATAPSRLPALLLTSPRVAQSIRLFPWARPAIAPMSSQDIVTRTDRHLMATYLRAPGARSSAATARGSGTPTASEYLDLFACLAVTNLGHAPRAVAEAIAAQTAKLFHVSNLHYCEPQARLVELLCAHSFADRVFLCNSGAEANEAAIKLARRWGHANGGRRASRSSRRSARSTAGRSRRSPRPDRRRCGSASSRCRRASATCPTTTSRRSTARSPTRPRRSCSSRSSARAASSCRAPSYLVGRAAALRRARRAADARRDPGRHGPDRDALRLRAARHRARRHHARQGARERHPDRRLCSRASEVAACFGSGRARLDVRRQRRRARPPP